MKRLALGNEAVARGLYEAGVRVVSSYPGTPSTEITEYAAKYDEIYCEWAPNEKVALEVAVGAAVAGARAFCAMKHVGLNVAADPLFTASYTGVNGGLVIAVADDPGMHSSQNEQDSRHYARAAKVPMLEPCDSGECKEFVKLAYELSERFDTPVILRLSTRISHSQGSIEEAERADIPLKDYIKDTAKYVMMPNFARPRHVKVEDRVKALVKEAETIGINTVEMNDTRIGVIASGTGYLYAREALGDKASYLKLGMVYPLPAELIKDFASKVDTLYVIEELDDFIETHCRALGLNVKGKDVFPMVGEYSPELIAEKILGEKVEALEFEEAVPPRPPVLCPGCPHRGVFYVLNKLRLTVSGDIGCYTLGALAPLNSLDFCLCMGASVSGLHGINKARGEMQKKAVAVIGDSTFIHSGITGLINIAYNRSNSVVLILDNRITGMTGHQQNPTTGFTLKGETTAEVNLEALCRACGIESVTVIDPADMKEMERVIRRELEADGPSVIIARRPCALLKYVKAKPPLKINEKCTRCKMCMRIGCPAISLKDGKIVIDPAICVGCDLCVQMCNFGAIVPAEGEGK